MEAKGQQESRAELELIAQAFEVFRASLPTLDETIEAERATEILALANVVAR